MKTQVLGPAQENLQAAAELLRSGQLVAFPTETVYGLGANAFDKDAVLSIFAAKDRPADNPLIVHVWCREQLKDICEVSETAEKLMDAFWPGPLTILMPRKESIPLEVTAGLPTVAVRMPSHPVAAALLKACNVPVAAPSANRSGKPSPTSARYVYQDMDGRIPMIIDGGDCDVGLESTVLDIGHGKPCILRPGGVTRDMLEKVLGEVDVAGSVLRPLQQGEVALSPGMRYKHYAPNGQVVLVEGEEQQVVGALRRLCEEAAQNGHKSCVMCFTEHAEQLADCHPFDLGSIHRPEETARCLFDTLRRLDDVGMDAIFSEVLPPEGIGLAVMNRLGRAAGFHSVQAEDILRD
ncbi:MAG: L-threonylcarbamoyladenylate synthase [Clostridia bacterium]|nr:L-threonylcarbamoyladenylate synthase [Clostridia bacterium]